MPFDERGGQEPSSREGKEAAPRDARSTGALRAWQRVFRGKITGAEDLHQVPAVDLKAAGDGRMRFPGNSPRYMAGGEG